MTGAASFTVTVSDGQTPALTDTGSVTVTITVVNDAPVLAPIGGRTVMETANVSITPTATDVDEDALTFTTGAIPAGASFLNGVFSWTPGYDQAGNHPVTFKVTGTDRAP